MVAINSGEYALTLLLNRDITSPCLLTKNFQSSKRQTLLAQLRTVAKFLTLQVTQSYFLNFVDNTGNTATLILIHLGK
jgi:hypothetical protein